MPRHNSNKISSEAAITRFLHKATVFTTRVPRRLMIRVKVMTLAKWTTTISRVITLRYFTWCRRWTLSSRVARTFYSNNWTTSELRTRKHWSKIIGTRMVPLKASLWLLPWQALISKEVIKSNCRRGTGSSDRFWKTPKWKLSISIKRMAVYPAAVKRISFPKKE